MKFLRNAPTAKILRREGRVVLCLGALALPGLLPADGRADDMTQVQRELPRDFFENVVWSASGEVMGRDRQNGIESLRAAMRAKAHGTSGETPLAAPPPSPPARHPVDVQRLLSRGRVLIAAGDIGGARLVFEHAAADNDPAALFALAETYDPIVLKRWRVFGLKADPEKARFLYDQASFYRMRLAQRRLAVVSQSIEGPAE